MCTICTMLHASIVIDTLHAVGHLDMVVHHALGSVREDEVLGVVAPRPSRVLVPQRLLRLQVVLCDAGLLIPEHKEKP